MYITIVAEMGQAWEDKCEVVGQGSFASPNACRLTVARMREGVVAGRSNADVMTPAAVAFRLQCLWLVA